MTYPVSRCPATSRDGRIRTGDPLNPIRLPDGRNHGKKPHKPLAGRTICNIYPPPMLTSAALNRHMNRPNRHINRPKDELAPTSAVRGATYAPLGHSRAVSHPSAGETPASKRTATVDSTTETHLLRMRFRRLLPASSRANDVRPFRAFRSKP